MSIAAIEAKTEAKTEAETKTETKASPLPETIAGYRTFTLGAFALARDEHFVTISWPARGHRQSHTMSADAFLRAMMRDVAWSFFYGLVNFDGVFGTRN